MSSVDTEDIGGELADYAMFMEEMASIQGIKEDRRRRTQALSGKYVVITNGRSSGKTVFMQDPNISRGGYWTQYLSNALGFTEKSKAQLIARGMRYNNPRVAIVNANGNYTFV